MRNYELIFIIQPELDENAVTAVIEKVTAWITEANGAINKVENWGKRRMAYAINKRRDGQYVFIDMQMPPTYSSELERNIRFLEPVMRYSLIVRTEHRPFLKYNHQAARRQNYEQGTQQGDDHRPFAGSRNAEHTSGRPVTTFSIATSRNWKPYRWRRHTETEWFKLSPGVTWPKSANNI
jgi:small subunit ribosomal protein S6